MLAKQILVISILIPFIEYYSYVAVRKSTQSLDRKERLWLIALYILLSAGVIWALFSVRSWATTEWPSHFIKIIVNFFIGLFFGKLLIASIMFLWDIIIVIKKALYYLITLPERIKSDKPVNIKPITRSEFISRGALITGAAFTLTLGLGMANKYRYKLRHTPVWVKNIPDAFKGLKIAQISDIHTGSLDNRAAVTEGINLLLSAKPDIILFTGDLVNYRASEVQDYFEILSRLKAPLGVFSILGNHDYGDYLSWPSEQDKVRDFEQLKEYHRLLGWKLLMNEHVVMKWKDQEFALIGVENWSMKARFPKYGKLDQAMSGLENFRIPLKILMSHDPSHWDAQVRPGYPDIALTLSGHTHGMQLGIEIPGFKWSPSKFLYKQWAGLYRENDQYLYVNRGFGFIGYDGRVGIMPEVALLELV